MICNLTLNPAEYYSSDEIIDFKKDEVAALYKEFWSDYIADYIVLAKNLADIAEESGAKNAVFDVPAYAVSILETELMLRKILPLHYYSGEFIETKSEVLLENLYAILENHTSEELIIEEEFKEEESHEAINVEPYSDPAFGENLTIQLEPIEEKVAEVPEEKNLIMEATQKAPGHSLNISIKQKFKY